MKMMTTWRCGHCGVEAVVYHDTPSDPPLPAGWTWQPYKSRRNLPFTARSLGCSPEHARLAALTLGEPIDDGGER